MIQIKILHIDLDDFTNPLAGGQANRTYEVYKRLSKYHEITVLTHKYPESKNEVINDIQYIRIGSDNICKKISQIAKVKLPTVRALYFIYKILTSIRKKYIEKENYDLLVEDFTSPISTTFTPLFTKKPVIGMAQNFFATETSKKYGFPFYLIEKFGSKQYKYFIAPSYYIKNKILNYNHNANIEIIPYGVDSEFFDDKSIEKDYILFIGRIDVYQKGIDLLLQSFKRISKKVDTELVIAGRGDIVETSKLLNLIKKLGLTSKVRLTGYVTGKNKIKLYSECKFICMPSRYETFGLVALEGVASGKPVLAFNAPGLEIVNAECGIKVDNFDTISYSEHMLKLLNDGNLRHHLGSRGREIAKRYTWDEVAKKQETFYLKVVESQCQQ